MNAEIKSQCIQVRKDPIVSLSEKNCKLILDNKDRKDVVIIQIDGCAIDDDSIKCDMAYCCNGEDHFVELKGNQLSHAIDQLERSISMLGTPKQTKTFAEIVYGNCNIPSNDFMKKVKRFHSKGIKLVKYKSNTHVCI